MKRNDVRRARDAAGGQLVADRLRLAHTHWTRLKGLLGTTTLEPGNGLWIEPCRQVHMFGMRYAIDVVFLDEARRVVHLLRGLAPWRVSPRIAAATSVLELPAGTIERTGLVEGARIEIEADLPVATAGADAPLRGPLLRVLLVVGALLLCTLVGADPDLWGHVRYGEDVLDAGALPRTATHTFTARGYPWINHENLAEIVFAMLVRSTGAPGLLALRLLLALGVVALMIRAGERRGASPLVLSLVVMLAAYNIAPGWTIRPQLFTFAFFALMVALLDRAFEARDREPGEGLEPRWLWFLPPLFILWANAHGGFLAGWCILGLFLACRSLEPGASRREVLTCGAILVTCGLATLLNPYGFELVRWLAEDLSPPRPEITEWAAIWPPGLHFVPFVLLLGLTAVAWLGSRRRRPLAQTVVLAVVAWQSARHVRHIPLFATLAGFWLPAHLESLWRRSRRVEPAVSMGRGGGMVHWAMNILALGAAVVLLTRMRALWVDKSKYPVEAIVYMAEHDLGGRLVAYFDWSQYALAALAPPTTVAFDGRFRTCYPQEIADAHFDLFLGDLPGRRWRSDRSPPIDPTRVLEMGEPDLVLLTRRAGHAVKVMQGRSDWVLLYQDGLAQLWGRRRIYDNTSSHAYLPPERRSISDRPQKGLVRWPALPAEVRSARSGRAAAG